MDSADNEDDDMLANEEYSSLFDLTTVISQDDRNSKTVAKVVTIPTTMFIDDKVYNCQESFLSYREIDSVPLQREDLTLPLFNGCGSRGNYPVMPALRLANLDREYREPTRNREKNWIIESQREIVESSVSQEIADSMKSTKQLRLGNYSKPESIPKLFWSPAFQSLIRKKRLLRTAGMISHTNCMIDIYGMGINGRIFSEGSPTGKLLIIDVFSCWNCQKYLLLLPCNELRILFASRQEFLKPGRKFALVQEIIALLYFDYTITIPPSHLTQEPVADLTVEAKEALELQKAVLTVEKDDAMMMKTGEGAAQCAGRGTAPVPEVNTERLQTPEAAASALGPDIVISVSHLDKPKMPSIEYPSDVSEIIYHICLPNEDPSRPLATANSSIKVLRDEHMPKLAQELKIGLERRENGRVLRHREVSVRRAVEEAERERVRRAWLKIPRRKRGLDATWCVRTCGRLMVLSAYRRPIRPNSVVVKGHVVDECSALLLNIGLGLIGDLYKRDTHASKWPAPEIVANIYTMLGDVQLEMDEDTSDANDSAHLAVLPAHTPPGAGVTGGQSHLRRPHSCFYKRNKLLSIKKCKQAEHDFWSSQREGDIGNIISKKKPNYVYLRYSDERHFQIWSHSRKVEFLESSGQVVCNQQGPWPYSGALGIASTRAALDIMSGPCGLKSSAKPRRDIGRGQRLCCKSGRIGRVYCVSTLYLASGLISGTAPQWVYEESRAASSADVAVVPQTSPSSPSTNSIVHSRGNSEQSATSSSKKIGRIDTNDSAGDQLIVVENINDKRTQIYYTLGLGLTVEMDIYVPYATDYMGLNIAASSLFRIALTKEDLYALIDDKDLLYAACTGCYNKFYESASAQAVSDCEIAWQTISQKILRKITWTTRNSNKVAHVPLVSPFRPAISEELDDNDIINTRIDDLLAATTVARRNSRTSLDSFESIMRLDDSLAKDNVETTVAIKTKQKTSIARAKECLWRDYAIVDMPIALTSSGPKSSNLKSSKRKNPHKKSHGIVLPTLSTVIFAKTLPIPIISESNEGLGLEGQSTIRLQVSYWQRGDEVGVVAYDTCEAVPGHPHRPTNPTSEPSNNNKIDNGGTAESNAKLAKKQLALASQRSVFLAQPMEASFSAQIESTRFLSVLERSTYLAIQLTSQLIIKRSSDEHKSKHYQLFFEDGVEEMSLGDAVEDNYEDGALEVMKKAENASKERAAAKKKLH